MTTTQLKKEFDTYLPLLSERQQEILMDMVKNFLHIDKNEKRISVAQYNKEIDASVKQIKEGKVVSHSEALKQSKQWLKRK